MKTTYEVRFTLYHYNSGDGHNGEYIHKETFPTLDKAKIFEAELSRWLTNGKSTNVFASQYCWDGYLVAVNGIYEITKKRIS